MNTNSYIDNPKYVKYCRVNSGYEHQINTARKFLTKECRYTVIRIETGQWHTDYFLKEIPEIGFNSCLFVDA